jgi:hypothetical protein
VDALEAFATSGTNFNPIELDFDCLSDDCSYTGGVNFHLLDDEYEPDSPSEHAWSDNESLCELEGDDLEENLSLWVSSSSLVVYPCIRLTI